MTIRALLLAALALCATAFNGCSSGNNDVTVQVGKGSPKAAEDGTLTLSGIYEGKIQDGHQMFVLARQGQGDYTLLWPPPDVDTSIHTWTQHGIDLTAGGWSIEVCLAGQAVAKEMANRGTSGELSGISQLPTGMRSVHQMTLMIQGAPAVAQDIPRESTSRSKNTQVASTESTPRTSTPDPSIRDNSKKPSPKAGEFIHPNLLPRSDYVLIRFDQPLDRLRRARRFGIFREISESRDVQWIEESFERVIVGPKSEKTGAMKLNVKVPGPSTYNGWWASLKNEDWSKYREWSVVLRLRLADPISREFKFELKTGPTEFYPAIVRVSDDHLAEMARDGFFDVELPIGDIMGNSADLSRMHEMVLAFENDRLDHPEQCTVWVHSIRLSPPAVPGVDLQSNALMDDLGRRAFSWFLRYRNPDTGLVLDRGPNSAVVDKSPKTCSIAAVGYYLSMLPEAVRTGQIDEAKARQHAEQVLKFVMTMDHHAGLLYHFCDVGTGKPLVGSEVSALDSAIFFNGCMVASEAYGGRIKELSDALLDRADWTAFEVEHPQSGKRLLSLGWDPKKGLLGPMDVRSSEMAMPYFLAVGSRTHPVAPELWYNTEVRTGETEGHKVLNPRHPLFTSYYSLSWQRVGKDRDGVDLEENAREMALANRAYCKKHERHARAFRADYGAFWGVSAGDSPSGYKAPSLVFGEVDGTVWPTAALAAVKWIPVVLSDDLDRWKKSDAWRIAMGPYGLSPLNLDKNWVAPDLIAIDLGSFYLNLANHRNETIRDLWMRHPVSVSALERLEYENASSSR